MSPWSSKCVLVMLDLYFIPACCSSAIHSHNPPLLLLLLLLADQGVCVCVCARIRAYRQHILSVEGHTFDPWSGQSFHSSCEQDVEYNKEGDTLKPVMKPFKPVSQLRVIRSFLPDSKMAVMLPQSLRQSHVPVIFTWTPDSFLCRTQTIYTRCGRVRDAWRTRRQLLTLWRTAGVKMVWLLVILCCEIYDCYWIYMGLHHLWPVHYCLPFSPHLLLCLIVRAKKPQHVFLAL